MCATSVPAARASDRSRWKASLGRQAALGGKVATAGWITKRSASAARLPSRSIGLAGIEPGRDRPVPYFGVLRPIHRHGPAHDPRPSVVNRLRSAADTRVLNVGAASVGGSPGLSYRRYHCVLLLMAVAGLSAGWH